MPVLSIFLAAPGARSAVLAANDPGSTRLVYGMVAGLVVVGIALAVLGVWLVRQTRYDPPVLAPLERMGDVSWRKRDPATQRRILDEVRPEGAEPLAVGQDAPTLDAEFDDASRPVPALDDLGPGVAPESTEQPTPDPGQQTDTSIGTSTDASSDKATDASTDTPTDESER